MKRSIVLATVALLLFAAITALAQRRSQLQDTRNEQFRNGVPTWENDAEFPTDVFTFVRIEYDSGQRGRRGYGRGWAWRTDYPDSDLNLSFRLQELTTLKVDPY